MSAFARFFSRAPGSRFAAFSCPSAVRLVAVLLLALTLGAGFGSPTPGLADDEADASEREQTEPELATPAPTPITLAGVSYTDAQAYFARLGYKAAYEATTQTLTLATTASELVVRADSRDARLNGLRVFLGEPALPHQGALHIATLDIERFLLPILRPVRFKPRPLRTIVIDAGHGGNDTGTQNKKHKLDEKVFALDVARRLERLLAGERWRVLMTRTEDRFVALTERAEFSNKADADLFISIHFNAVANNAAVRGTETYVLTPQFQRSTSSLKALPEDKLAQPGNAHDAWSAVLGYHVHRQLLAALKTEDRGYKRARFAVLRLVDCPAVLVEAGYLSNNDEAKRIADEDYRAEIAAALYAAVQAYDALASAAAR